MSPNLEEHYSQLLGLTAGWSVKNVDLDLQAQRVVIRVVYDEKGCACPVCGAACTVYDQRGDVRQWRHLDTMQFETLIESAIPRSRCAEHGVKSLVVPWSEKNSRFTLLFEAFALRVLQSARSVKEASHLLRLNWHQVDSIKARGVARGLSRRRATKISFLGIDEKSHHKGHSYVTLVNDLEGSRVLDIAEDRTQEACELALEKALSKQQRAQVKAVAIDMWPAYINAVGDQLGASEIVHDRFHIHKHLNDAVDQVRKKEHKELLGKGDRQLSKTRYLWLKNEENLGHEASEHLKVLTQGKLKTARAWAIKELFNDFWRYASKGWGRRHFEYWYSWAIRSRLEPIKRVARLIKNHLEEILTWFRHRISNAVSEGLNSKIQTVKSNARGFRSFESYRRSILFYCGKLDMIP